MSGAYLRVQRDGKWQTIEVEYLTVAERKQALSGRPEGELLRWIDTLCNMLANCQAPPDE